MQALWRTSKVIYYLLSIIILFAFITGHATASFHRTGEWFYRFAAWLFLLSTLGTLVALWMVANPWDAR